MCVWRKPLLLLLVPWAKLMFERTGCWGKQLDFRDGNEEFGDKLIKKIFKRVYDYHVPEN